MEGRIVKHNDVKWFVVELTWDDKTKAKIRKTLETGAWVALLSKAIGHDIIEAVELTGLEWLEREYAGILQYGKDDWFGKRCVRLM